MPATRKLPDLTTLRRLRSQGWRLKDIADAYDVTEAAVWKALERGGFTVPQKNVHDVIPWQVADEHKATAIMERFRSIVKQQKGALLRADEEQLLNRWLHDLTANNVVVAYHPDAPPNAASRKGGFYYTERKPEDEWIIRRPKTDADLM